MSDHPSWCPGKDRTDGKVCADEYGEVFHWFDFGRVRANTEQEYEGSDFIVSISRLDPEGEEPRDAVVWVNGSRDEALTVDQAMDLATLIVRAAAMAARK